MNHKTFSLLLCSSAMLALNLAYAVENANPTPSPAKEEKLTPFEQGKQLHAGQCVTCHSDLTGGKPNDLYTRKDRKINRYESLQTQVLRCAANLNLAWFDDDIANVVTYLNSDFYKFDTEPKKSDTPRTDTK